MDTSILGIDVASRKLDFAWSSEAGWHHATVDYDRKSLDDFLSTNKTIKPGSCQVGLESTGDYHIAVGQYFIKHGFTVRLINPILTRHYTRLTIRGAKTDVTDAQLICKLIADDHGDVLTWQDVANRDKELLRLSHHLTQAASQLKQRLGSTRRKQLPDTNGIEAKLERVIGRVSKLSRELVEEVTAEPSADEQLIISIPGFGVKLAAMVHHELGDVSRFRNVRALIAYAGLEPRMRQSGTLLNTTGRISKRGSAELRYALFLAANVGRRYEPELKKYYEKKRSQGRSHKEVLCVISRKQLRRVAAVLKERRTYVIR